MKRAGLRTCALIGVASALVMLVSKYGFGDVPEQGRIVLDPSRVAAQIVSGIGFIGGGLIFVRQDVAHGLTTAATVWLVAAVGLNAATGKCDPQSWPRRPRTAVPARASPRITKQKDQKSFN